MMKQQQVHWRDRAISAAEVISDGFDVVKAYGAHLANWILFFCLIANLIEMVSPGFEAVAGLVIVGIQSISLDIAGFGLTAMASSAKRRGDNKSAMKANVMGWTLITVMAITVGLITLAAFKPEWASSIQQANQMLMFVRVIVTVFYGHIVHQIREEGTAHEHRVAELEKQVSSLQYEVSSKQKEVSSVQSQVSSGQQTVDTLRQQLDTQRQHAQAQLDTLRGQLDIKQQEIESLHAAMSSGQDFQASRLSALQQEVEREQSAHAVLRRELFSAKAELEHVQSALSSEQQMVSSLRKELSSVQRQVDTLGVHSPAKKVSSQVSTGHTNVVQLDSRRRVGQDETEAQIRALHKVTPVQSLSARGIAGQIGCSPTTAAKWKLAIENEEKLVANE